MINSIFLEIFQEKLEIFHNFKISILLEGKEIYSRDIILVHISAFGIQEKPSCHKSKPGVNSKEI